MTTQTEAPLQLNRLDTLELEVSQKMAAEYAKIAPLFATDASEATKQIQELQRKVRDTARTQLDAEKEKEGEAIKVRAQLVTEVKTAGLPHLQKVWDDNICTLAEKLPHVERWTFIVETDTDKSTTTKAVYKPGTLVDGTPRTIRTGATTDTNGGGSGSQPVVITGIKEGSTADASKVGTYPSAKQTKEKVLGLTSPMNRGAILSKLATEGYIIAS